MQILQCRRKKEREDEEEREEEEEGDGSEGEDEICGCFAIRKLELLYLRIDKKE